MADYYTHFSAMFDPGPGNVEAAIALAKEMEENPEAFELEFFHLGVEAQVGKVWIHDDLGNDLDAAATFAIECGKRFGLKGRWGFEYGNTCTKPRLDAYGGGVVVVDLEAGKWDSMHTSQVYEAWMKGDSFDC